MSEGEPRFIGPRNETPPTPAQKVAYYTSIIAEDNNLDRITYEALSKYANTSLRIREIITDFRGTQVAGVKYPVRIDDQGTVHKIIIPRGAYSDYVRSLSTIAHNLYETYLSGNPASRAAAKEVQVIVNDFFPKNP